MWLALCLGLRVCIRREACSLISSAVALCYQFDGRFGMLAGLVLLLFALFAVFCVVVLFLYCVDVIVF